METIMYKVISETIIQRLSDEAFIPVDLANRDYQRYLNPEAEEFRTMVTDAPKP